MESITPTCDLQSKNSVGLNYKVTIRHFAASKETCFQQCKTIFSLVDKKDPLQSEG